MLLGIHRWDIDVSVLVSLNPENVLAFCTSLQEDENINPIIVNLKITRKITTDRRQITLAILVYRLLNYVGKCIHTTNALHEWPQIAFIECGFRENDEHDRSAVHALGLVRTNLIIVSAPRWYDERTKRLQCFYFGYCCWIFRICNQLYHHKVSIIIHQHNVYSETLFLCIPRIVFSSFHYRLYCRTTFAHRFSIYTWLRRTFKYSLRGL